MAAEIRRTSGVAACSARIQTIDSRRQTIRVVVGLKAKSLSSSVERSLMGVLNGFAVNSLYFGGYKGVVCLKDDDYPAFT